MPITLADHLIARKTDPAMSALIETLGAACADISRTVALGALTGSLGVAGSTNVQGEEQKQLDVITNDMLSARLQACPVVAGLASEELETIETTGRAGGFLVTFDPLDGSSNIDINAPVGTIFSVLPAPVSRAPTQADFLQSGRHQVAAGYAVYGPQSMLVLTLLDGVKGFTLGAAT